MSKKSKGTETASGFDFLDKMDNIKPNIKDGKRKTTSLQDAVSKRVDEMTLPSQLGEFANKFGLSVETIKEYATSAPNFGLFRMRVVNKVRGVVHRMEEATKLGMKDVKPSDVYETGDFKKLKKAIKSASGVVDTPKSESTTRTPTPPTTTKKAKPKKEGKPKNTTKPVLAGESELADGVEEEGTDIF